MFDALLKLLPAGAIAAGNGATFNLKVGNSPRPMYVNIPVNQVATTSGTGALYFTVEHSDDGTNFFTHSSGAIEAVALSTTPVDAEIVIPVLTTRPYLRVVTVLSGTGAAGTLPAGARLGVSPR